MTEQYDLEKDFCQTLKDGAFGSNVVDLELRKIVARLGLSVLRLDRTSTKLAYANISFAGVLAIIGIVQICLMAKGH